MSSFLEEFPTLNSVDLQIEKLVEKKILNENSVIYFTSDIPLEIISAFDLNPVRLPSSLTSNSSKIGIDTVIQPFICSKVRNLLQNLLNIDFNFNYYIFSENYCDSLQNLSDIFLLNRSTISTKNLFRFLLPIRRGDLKVQNYFMNECKRLIEWLEGASKLKITKESLQGTIELYNKKRNLLRRLSTYLIKTKYNNFSYKDFLTIKTYIDLLPIDMAIQSLELQIKRIDKEDDNKKLDNNVGNKRILLAGTMFDQPKLFEKIPILDQSIILDNLSFGSKSFDYNVDIEKLNSDDISFDMLLQLLASGYINNKPSDAVHHDPIRKKERLLTLVQKNEVNGVIFLYYNFCDPDGFETRIMANYLKKYNINSLIVQTDPQLSNLQQLTTRIEAFMET